MRSASGPDSTRNSGRSFGHCPVKSACPSRIVSSRIPNSQFLILSSIALMNNLLRQEKRKAALSVNDMGSINVDADRICREFLSELKKAGRYRRLCPLSIRLGWSCRSLSTSICIRTALRETGAGAFDLLTKTSYYVSIS